MILQRILQFLVGCNLLIRKMGTNVAETEMYLGHCKTLPKCAYIYYHLYIFIEIVTKLQMFLFDKSNAKHFPIFVALHS